MTGAAPTGEQFAITHGEHRAVVVEVGGGLRTYTVGDRDVVDGYAEDAQCDGGRGQTLVPWPNRVRDGSWTWDGVTRQLALTEPEQRNAIHGLVRWMPWSVVERSTSAVTLACRSFPQPGYPWTLAVRTTWALDGRGLGVRTEITNVSGTAAPVAAGFHPYLTLAGPRIDEAVLTLPADTVLVTDARSIPTGSRPVAGTEFDFRTPRAVGAQAIDHAFTGLTRTADGRCTVVLASADGARSVELWVDEAYLYLEVFTGDTLADPARRRQGLAVEPMSAPPNALASGEALVTVAPGASWTGNWGIVPG